MMQMFQSFRHTSSIRSLEETSSGEEGGAAAEEFLPCQDDILTVVQQEFWYQVRRTHLTQRDAHRGVDRSTRG